jgi:hypothetical protein
MKQTSLLLSKPFSTLHKTLKNIQTNKKLKKNALVFQQDVLSLPPVLRYGEVQKL